MARSSSMGPDLPCFRPRAQCSPLALRQAFCKGLFVDFGLRGSSGGRAMIRPVQKHLDLKKGRASDAASAADFLPRKLTLTSLKRAAAACEGCPLYREATQTVFGEGPADAQLVLVGETPGDQEDLQGRPFVGPAGRLLDEALVE